MSIVCKKCYKIVCRYSIALKIVIPKKKKKIIESMWKFDPLKYYLGQCQLV